MTEFDSEELLICNAQVVTMSGSPPTFGGTQSGQILIRDGVLAAVGTDACASSPRARVMDAGGHLVTPGLIDCHTHVVYGGQRSAEFCARMAGESYESIARQGGGILSTVRATRAASEEELLGSARRRLIRFIADGLTTVEIKSGYGLDLESELKMLRVARQLGQRLPLDVRTTLLAAHAVPPEYAGRADAYVDWVCGTMIPAAIGLADAVDVFCESIAFDVRQSERVLQTAARYDLARKIHAEQRSNLGGAAMAAEQGALSADHLEYLDQAGATALARQGTVATLLPAAYYFLREHQLPPVTLLRQLQVPLAVGSDTNPGSAPVGSLQLVLNLACVQFGLTPTEALAGMTCQAARALGIHDRVGTLKPGKQADLVIWNVRSIDELAYPMAARLAGTVIKRGICVDITALS